MAYVKKAITSEEWTLILTNVSIVTFQNASQFGVYINYTANTTAPADEVGLVYGPWQGELNRPIEELSSIGGYVWAKAISRQGSIIVDE